MRKQAQILLLVIIPQSAVGYRLLRDATLNISYNCLWMIIYARIKQKNKSWPINICLGLSVRLCYELWRLSRLKASHAHWMQKDEHIFTGEEKVIVNVVSHWNWIHTTKVNFLFCPSTLPLIITPKMFFAIDGIFFVNNVCRKKMENSSQSGWQLSYKGVN